MADFEDDFDGDDVADVEPDSFDGDREDCSMCGEATLEEHMVDGQCLACFNDERSL